jgi:leucine-rich repeat protein SHOC2
MKKSINGPKNRSVIHINSLEKIMGNIAHTVSLIKLCFLGKEITKFSENLSVLSNLTYLYLSGNDCTYYGTDMHLYVGKSLIYLRFKMNRHAITQIFTGNNLIRINGLKNEPKLYFYNCRLDSLPKSIGNLHDLIELHCDGQRLKTLPNSIGNLSNLESLYLRDNQLINLPDSIGNLSNLQSLYLGNNQLTRLPNSLSNLARLYLIDINDNFIKDLSILRNIPNLKCCSYLNVNLTNPRYFTKLSEWKEEWLKDEEDSAIRQVLIEQLRQNNRSSDYR